MSLAQVIQVNPDIQGGTPCFAGTRVPVKSLFDALRRGRSLDYFLEQFPSVKREQALLLLEEASNLVSSGPRGMKVLLDENLPRDLRSELADFEVFTVQYLGWGGMKNGALLIKAADAGFDVIVTMDSGVQYQQGAKSLRLAVIVLSAASNDMEDLLPLVPRLRQAIQTLKPKSVIRVS